MKNECVYCSFHFASNINYKPQKACLKSSIMQWKATHSFLKLSSETTMLIKTKPVTQHYRKKNPEDPCLCNWWIKSLDIIDNKKIKRLKLKIQTLIKKNRHKENLQTAWTIIVSTLSGLNFNLYLPKLKIKKIKTK